MADEKKKLLLNLISDVKSRLEGKVDNVSFPIPQFIVIGKQSVGKSRLIEALAGETFNFVSGTLGSRRPTVLEFRNVAGLSPSRWAVYDKESNSWQQHPIQQVMKIIGQAHESLGANVSEEPVRVKVEGADCVDLGIVDLPGFRAYAKDAKMQELSTKIEKLADHFMQDENNVMLAVEEAGDAAGFATLGRCKMVDPNYRRTILIRNKLDKYYGDLTAENVNKWLEGFGDLPPNLVRFAVSLPHWASDAPPKPFGQMRIDCSEKDVSTLKALGASQKYLRSIGFQNFKVFTEVKIQELFAAALGPLLTRLKNLRENHTTRLTVIEDEFEVIDENNILHATRSAGISFAQSFNFLMEGALSSEKNRLTLEEELLAFHKYCDGRNDIEPEERIVGHFGTVQKYIQYLRDPMRVPGMDVELNGGAQFKRLMYEVEVFVRFAGLGQRFNVEDVIQARGTGVRATTWKDVIVNLMLQNAPTSMMQKTKYVGARLQWFFTQQKEATVDFMLGLKGSPEEHLFSGVIFKQAQVITRNQAMKSCIFEQFDKACQKNCKKFMDMWSDYLSSMFQSPMVLLKSCSTPKLSEEDVDDAIAPTLEITKARINTEVRKRSSLSSELNEDIKNIPDDDFEIKKALGMVENIIERTFAVIRSQVADQMQLYSESFFLLPMLRRLEGEMADMQLADEDKVRYRARAKVLNEEKTFSSSLVNDLDWCIDAVEKFKVTCGGTA